MPSSNEHDGKTQQPLSGSKERNWKPLPLNEHEAKVQKLLMDLAHLPGFPNDERKLYNVVRAYARFASTEPYEVKFIPEIDRYLTDEQKQPFMSLQGIVPMEWLVAQITDRCRYFPQPIEARAILDKGGFAPLDGKTADELAVDNRAARAEE